MSAVPKPYISEAEYLAEERKAETKSEYYNGEVFAMAGASETHNAITVATGAALFNFLRKASCRVYQGDMRVHNKENSLYTYPDIVVVCGERQFLDDEFDTLTNPVILIEVLSPSTEDYDRGTKFKLYRTISSLQHYVLISSTEVLAEVYTRQGQDWLLSSAKGLEAKIHLSAINFNLVLSDVYAQTDLQE